MGKSHKYRLIVAHNLHNLRKTKKMTQQLLSMRSGVSLQQISRIERGECSPSVDTLIRLACALEIEPSNLLKRANDSVTRYYFTKLDEDKLEYEN